MQSLGVDIGSHLVPANEGNPHGHFEDADILTFHQDILNRLGNHGDGFFDDGMLRQTPLDFFPSTEEIQRAQSLIQIRSENGGLWGWKEPRTCLFLDFWQRQLPDMKGVIVYRHPMEVHGSILRRRHWDYVFYPAQVIHSYVCYNATLLKALDEQPNGFYCINANAAFADLPQLRQGLIDFIGISVPDDAPTAGFFADEFKQLRITEKHHTLFARVFPEAAAQFDALQRKAGIPYAFSAAVPEDVLIDQVLSVLDALVAQGRAIDPVAWMPILETIFWPDQTQTHELRRRDVVAQIQTHVAKLDTWANEMQLRSEKLDALLKQSYSEKQVLWEDLTKVGKSWEAQKQQLSHAIEDQTKTLAQKAELDAALTGARHEIDGLRQSLAQQLEQVTVLSEKMDVLSRDNYHTQLNLKTQIESLKAQLKTRTFELQSARDELKQSSEATCLLRSALHGKQDDAARDARSASLSEITRLAQSLSEGQPL
jgi:hypothetical protein